jgi:hypothetical protein
VFDRLLAADVSIERIEQHLATGLGYIDDELVTDPYRPAPPPARVGLNAPQPALRGTARTRPRRSAELAASERGRRLLPSA